MLDLEWPIREADIVSVSEGGTGFRMAPHPPAYCKRLLKASMRTAAVQACEPTIKFRRKFRQHVFTR